MLRTEHLTKIFEVGVLAKKLKAVDDLTLSIQPGEIFGFVGPNGAGKTTTIKMLMGLIYPTRGKAFIFDAPIPSQEAQRRIGYLPENPSYYDFLTGKEALHFFATLAEVPAKARAQRCAELLALVGLSDAADRQIRKYSKGMQQRLGIAQALLGDPALLVLDEPMSGLDPTGRREVRDLILELKARGKTVFFSTHILPDVESLCDRVGLILGGKLRDVGRLTELLSANIKRVEMELVAPETVQRSLAGGSVVRRDGDFATLAFPDQAAAQTAVKELVQGGGKLLSLTPVKETLEDFFVRRLQEAGTPALKPPRAPPSP